MVNDISYDEELIKEVLAKAFPNHHLLELERIEKGMMNLVAQATITNPDKEVIIKVSNQPKKYSIHKEAHLYEIAKKNDIPTPKIYYSDFTKKHWPYEVFVAQKLPGVAVQDIWEQLPKHTKRYVAEQAGILFAKIHKITYDKPGQIHAEQTTTYNDLFEYMRTYIPENISSAREMQFIPLNIIDAIEETFYEHEEWLRNLNDYVLCHFDFHFGHLFINDQYQVTGVLDWGFAEIAPREMDFFKPHRWIFDKGTPYKKAFLEAYQIYHDLPEDFEKRVRFFRLFLDIKFVERLVKTNQEELAHEYVTKLKEHLGVITYSKKLK